MSSNCGIYQIKNTITGDYYIGSSGNLRKRFVTHRYCLSKNRHVNPHLQSAWNKYGADSFEFTTILLCPIEKNLYLEQGFLDLFKPVYNIAISALAPGQGRRHTEETKQKMSEAQKSRSPLSEETKRKIGEANKGKCPSKETRAKMSEAHKGKTNMLGHKHTDEARAKMSESQKCNTSALGHKHTDEARAKMSEANKGERHPNFSKHLSEKTRAKISEANKGKHPSEEARTKMSEAQKMRWMKARLTA